MKSPSGNSARHAARSFMYGEIRLAMQMTPESAKSLATSPEYNHTKKLQA